MAKTKLYLTANQRQFCEAIFNDTFYEQAGFGGARGGGKTFVSCLVMVLRRLKYAGSRGLMIRQTQGAADENLGEEIRKVLRLLGIATNCKGGVIWKEQKKLWQFPNGSKIYIGYCKKPNDWEKYQGQEYMDICFEEATQFLERAFIDIVASNRQTLHRGASQKVWITCNPGGIGTTWVKKRFITPNTRDRRTLWIKSLLRDNMAMLENDPGYRDRTLAKQPLWRQKQWEDGDWDSVEGLFWNLNPACIRKMDVPYWADVYAGVDAGFWPSAFAVTWIGKWKDADGKLRIHVWRELKKHKLNISQQAAEAKAIEHMLPFHIKARYADPAAWKRTEADGGINATTAYGWAQKGFTVAAAYTNARAAGWLLMRTLLDEHILTIDPSCMALKTEMEAAIHDDKSDDIDDKCEDHLQDALRYVLVSVLASVSPEDLTHDAYSKRQPKKLVVERKIITLTADSRSKN